MAAQRKCEFETTNPRYQRHNAYAGNLSESSEHRRCGRRAVVIENGVAYCKAHASNERREFMRQQAAERRAVNRARWDAQRAEWRARGAAFMAEKPPEKPLLDTMGARRVILKDEED